MYKLLIRPILFCFDPEKVHHFTFAVIRFWNKIPGFSSLFRAMYEVKDSRLEKEVFGLKFKNPVGLAAGFDKDAKMYHELSNLGFGFIEIGTLTPKPQDGNSKKRLFRLKSDRAIINRMGFNNGGVQEAVIRLKKNKGVLIGGNIGKNKMTSNEEAVKDYEICFDTLYDYVDYFVVNVSSPNTPNLRALQDKEPLTQLLQVLQNKNTTKPKTKPILLKIAPDLTNEQLLDIIDIIADTKIAGVIATNTTISREGLISEVQNETGGLSGKPLTKRSTEVIRFLSEKSNNAFPIIGVGGIHSPEDAIEKLEAGAALIQLYTGFIYEGPALIKKINKAILKKESQIVNEMEQKKINFEHQIRQKLLNEDYYHYRLKDLNFSIEDLLKVSKSIKDPYMATMVDSFYDKMCLEYTAGKPLEDILTLMEMVVKYTEKTQDFVERKAKDTWKKHQVMIELFSKLTETEVLSNLLGLCMLFNRMDWLQTIVSAISPFDADVTIDAFIAMKLPDYPITDEKPPKIFYFRKSLLKAIQATTEADTLKHLDDYLTRWYDGLRKLGYEYIDSHLDQDMDMETCSYCGYWAFDAAAVAYLKNIDDTSLHKYHYYPKDMVIYARENN